MGQKGKLILKVCPNQKAGFILGNQERKSDTGHIRIWGNMMQDAGQMQEGIEDP